MKEKRGRGRDTSFEYRDGCWIFFYFEWKAREIFATILDKTQDFFLKNLLHERTYYGKCKIKKIFQMSKSRMKETKF